MTRHVAEINYTERLVVEVCPTCFVNHAIPETLKNKALQQRDLGQERSVYCPNGHSWVYTGENKLERARRQLAEKELEFANLQESLRAEQAAHLLTQGKLTKSTHRADRGVCQHCKRSFVNVERHVKTKHPEVLT